LDTSTTPEPVPSGTPERDAVDFLLERDGMTRAQLAPLLGGPEHAAAFFAGARGLDDDEREALRAWFGVSAETLPPPG
jgi:hypothetical protein